MKSKGLILGLCLAGCVGIAQAQIATPKAHHRQHHQHMRIADGHASRECTRLEARQLRSQQRHIRYHKRAARADGHVSMKERAAIQRHQNKGGKSIYLKQHRVRYGR